MNATVTVFNDRHGTRITACREMSLAEVKRVITRLKPATSKDELPLLKFATFGDLKSDKGSLRHDANVAMVSGIEGDYDGEKMPMAEAVEICRQRGLAALFYTSASHTPEKPRWRVLCELAEPIQGNEHELRARRKHWVGVLNAVLGGVLKGESFSLSQCFYFGSIAGRPDPEYVLLEGKRIDELSNLPAPIIPLNGSTKTGTKLGDGGVGEDRSADLYGRVHRDVRRGRADYEIMQAHLNHPHARESRDPEKAVQRCIDKARQDKNKPPAEKELPEVAIPARSPLDFAALEGREPPERDWAITYWLPGGHTTLLAGKAGVGKTLIAQHLATSIAVKHEYIASVPRARNVLCWAGEDDHDELWRRQLRICVHLGVAMAELRNKLILQSYAGVDITLASPVFGQLQPTALMSELREQVHDYKAEVVILDNSARLFGGNENDRHAVTTFLAWLQAACAPAAILLLSHPAKSMGSEYSGSTAWEGAVRTRLYMSDSEPGKTAGRGDPDDDEGAPSPTERWLSRRKANYSPLDVRRFELTEDGVLQPEMDQGDFEDQRSPPTDAECRDTIRAAVTKLIDMNLQPTASKGSQSFLPKLAKGYSLLGRLSQPQFYGVMRGMLKDKELLIREVGRYSNRTPKMGVVLP